MKEFLREALTRQDHQHQNHHCRDKSSTWHIQGVQKSCGMLLDPQEHPLNHHWPAPLANGNLNRNWKSRLWKLFFCSCFLLTTKQDLVVPYHINGKIWPHCTRFWLGLLGSSSILSATFFGTTCIPPSNLKGEVALEFNYLKYYNAPSWLQHGICFPSTMLNKTCSIPFSTGAGLFKAGPAELERDNHRSLLHHCHSLHCGAEVYIPKTNK